MKKLLLALALVACASWAGTTYFSSTQTETAYAQMLEQMVGNESLVLKSTEYKAGMMQSTAITEVHSTEAFDKDLHFFLEHQINHSLVSIDPTNPRFGAANIVTTLKTDNNYSDDTKALVQSFESEEPFVITTNVAVDGSTSSEIRLRAVDHSKDQIMLKSSGGIINVRTTASGDVAGEAATNSFLLDMNTERKADLANVAIKFNMTKIAGENRLSQFFHDLNLELKIDKTTLDEADATSIQAEGIHYLLTQDFSSEAPSAYSNLSVDKLETDVIPLESFDIDITTTGFSIKELIANEYFINQVQAANNPAELLLSDQGLELIRATIQPETKIAVKFDATSTEGNSSAAVDLWFTGNGSDDGYTGMVTTGDLAKTIAGTAVADIDKATLMLTPLGSMLEQPMVQAYATVTDDKVMLNANLDNLILKLDKQVIPLEFLAGGMLKRPLESLLGM